MRGARAASLGRIDGINMSLREKPGRRWLVRFALSARLRSSNPPNTQETVAKPTLVNRDVLQLGEPGSSSSPRPVSGRPGRWGYTGRMGSLQASWRREFCCFSSIVGSRAIERKKADREKLVFARFEMKQRRGDGRICDCDRNGVGSSSILLKDGNKEVGIVFNV